MPIVTVQPEGVRVKVSYGSNLLFELVKAGFDLEAVCGGRGVCKKCLVEVLNGEAGEPSKAETEVVNVSRKMRLACQVKVFGDLVVRIPEVSQRSRGKILEWGRDLKVEFSPKVRYVPVRLNPPSLNDPRSDAKRLLDMLDARSIDSLLLKRLPNIIRKLGWRMNVILYDGEVLDIRPYDDDSHYGVAVDIGTTTAVVYLVDLRTGRIVAVKSDYNGQIVYGDDVVSRMEYATRSQDCLKELQEKIVSTINRLIQDATIDAGCSPLDIYEILFAGNTVMTSMLYGAEVSAIASAPYVPPFQSSLCFKARDIDVKVNSSAVAYTLPLVSGYVGGDVVADILVSGIHRLDEKAILIDLGTNGEVILKSGENILAASTAAGPAVEGAGLSNGMRGVAGAIESALIDPSTYEVYCRTIGGEEPQGICGSGMVDLIAWMIICGILDQSGRILSLDIPRIINVNGEKAFLVAVNSKGRKIFITQSDVRRFQLAKAAIFAACSTLMKIAGVRVEELSKLYIAGAFGNYVDPRSAMIVGIIPELPLRNIVQIGNGSGRGAVACLISSRAREESEAIARKVKVVNLNTISHFQSEFIDSTLFPHRRLEIFPKAVEAIKRKIPILD
ncbi:MAG: ASKHA domain-containing protein [Thermoproteota archaeon]